MFHIPLLRSIVFFLLIVEYVSSFQTSSRQLFITTGLSSSQHHQPNRLMRNTSSSNTMIMNMMVVPEVITELATTTTTTLIADNNNIIMVSPEPIHTAFSVATFLPQPFWLLMIVLPNNKFTKKVMGGLEIPLICCLVHFFIVVSSIVIGGSDATAPLAEFNNVFDPAGDPQKAFFGMTSNYPNFVAEEWSHVLTWDIFVGRYVWLDGLKRGIYTPISVLFCNLIGPPGLLIHWLTCTVSGKPIFVPNDEESAVLND